LCALSEGCYYSDTGTISVVESSEGVHLRIKM